MDSLHATLSGIHVGALEISQIAWQKVGCVLDTVSRQILIWYWNSKKYFTSLYEQFNRYKDHVLSFPRDLTVFQDAYMRSLPSRGHLETKCRNRVDVYKLKWVTVYIGSLTAAWSSVA